MKSPVFNCKKMCGSCVGYRHWWGHVIWACYEALQVKLCYLRTLSRLLRLHIVGDKWINVNGKLVLREGHRWTRTKTLAPLCPPQIPHELDCDWSKASVVWGRRLSKPCFSLWVCKDVKKQEKVYGWPALPIISTRYLPHRSANLLGVLLSTKTTSWSLLRIRQMCMRNISLANDKLLLPIL
jgi:hypothetical protein